LLLPLSGVGRSVLTTPEIEKHPTHNINLEQNNEGNKMSQKLKEFRNDDLATALENCQSEGYKAMFMPELADARVKGKAAWDKWYSTPSVRATGKTNQGNAVVVYAHIPNYFSNPENIKSALSSLVNGAGRMPQEEFQKLVDAEDGKKVFVVDYDKLKNSKSERIPLSEAIEHPQTIPFLGGQERAEEYLAKFKEAYNTNQIGIWHCDDLNENSLMGRLLFVGNDDYNLNGDGNLSNIGRFLGVRRERVAEDGAKKIKTPSLNEILKYSKNFVAKASQEDFEQGLRQLYQR